MKKIIKYSLILLMVLGVVSCVYPFSPEGIEEEIGVVVMEGDINAGVVSTFTPSTSIALADESGLVKALDLTTIYVESESGDKYSSFTTEESVDEHFLNRRKLSYLVDTRSLDKGKKHRLVFGANGKTYRTGWLEFVETAPIDSVTFKVAPDYANLVVMVNATGLNDSLMYYKWDYVEDWEFHSYYKQQVYYLRDSNQVYPIPEGQVSNYYCWNHKVSSEINIFSTKHLSQNVVINHPIRTIDNEDRRISYLYAIEVHQKGLSKEAYTYWETLLKNNDGSAGIFAPQPNELRGNIFCEENPEELVLGYISSCTVEKKRLYIDSKEHQIYRNPDKCDQQSMDQSMWKSMYDSNWDVVNIDALSGEIFWAPKKCVDCRVYGSKEKPDFWPNDHK